MQPQVPKVPCCTMAQQPRKSLIHGLGESEQGLGPRLYTKPCHSPTATLLLAGHELHSQTSSPSSLEQLWGHPLPGEGGRDDGQTRGQP